VFPDRTSWLAMLLAVAVGAAACGGGASGDDDDVGDDAGPPADASPASVKARIKFKGNDRLRNEFARALALEPAEVCTELGQYSCTHLVHQVALGGAEPYGLGLHEALPFTTVTTPIAVDRLALFACRERVDRDLAGAGGAVIYDGIDAGADARRGAIVTLYRRALTRDPTEDEIGHLEQLYTDVAAADPAAADRSWAIASCFAVTTTMEQLFY